MNVPKSMVLNFTFYKAVDSLMVFVVFCPMELLFLILA